MAGKYLRIYRLTEGNKQLARNVVSFLKQRDRVTATEWRETLKPLIQSVYDDIINQIKGYDLSYWTLVNLRSISNSILASIQSLDSQFSTALINSERKVAELTVDLMARQFKALGLADTGSVFNYDEFLGGTSPLTQAIVSNFTADVAKIINTQIATGIAGGKSTSDVAYALMEKFKSSDMSFERAHRIAMTEMNTISSFAQQIRGEEMAETNKGLRKVWISSHKPNARWSHLDVEQRSIENPLEMDEEFEVENESTGEMELAMFPRSPSLSAGNRIHCGCTHIFVNEGDTEMIDVIRAGVEDSGVLDES